MSYGMPGWSHYVILIQTLWRGFHVRRFDPEIWRDYFWYSQWLEPNMISGTPYIIERNHAERRVFCSRLHYEDTNYGVETDPGDCLACGLTHELVPYTHEDYYDHQCDWCLCCMQRENFYTCRSGCDFHICNYCFEHGDEDSINVFSRD